MSEETTNSADSEGAADNKADLRAVVIVFCAAVAMAIHFVSGFTFDF